MKKIFSVMLLAAMIIFVGGQNKTAAQELEFVPLNQDYGRVYSAWVVDGIDFLALRTGPSVNYPEIARIPPGTYIEVTIAPWDKPSNFFYVEYQGKLGWAHKNYIRLGRHLYDVT